MGEETIYTYILTKTDGTYIGWSRAEEEKPAGHGLKWHKWGKPLPVDIGYTKYKLSSGKLKKA